MTEKEFSLLPEVTTDNRFIILNASHLSLSFNKSNLIHTCIQHPHTMVTGAQYVFVRNVSKMACNTSKNIVFSPKKQKAEGKKIISEKNCEWQNDSQKFWRNLQI